MMNVKKANAIANVSMVMAWCLSRSQISFASSSYITKILMSIPVKDAINMTGIK